MAPILNDTAIINNDNPVHHEWSTNGAQSRSLCDQQTVVDWIDRLNLRI